MSNKLTPVPVPVPVPVPKRVRLLDTILETAGGRRTLKALLVLEEHPTSKGIATAWAKFGQSSVKLYNHTLRGLILCYEVQTDFRGHRAFDTYPLQWLLEEAEDALARFHASRSMHRLNKGALQAATGWLRYRGRQEEEALAERVHTALGIHLIHEDGGIQYEYED